MRRLLSLVMILFSFSLTACRETLAPEPDQPKIELQPFQFQVIEVPVGFMVSYQKMTFYGPLGAAPQILYRVEETVGNPKLEINLRPFIRFDEPCYPNCDQIAWELEVGVKANAVGEAIVYVFDKTNTSKKVSFRVVASNWGGEKG